MLLVPYMWASMMFLPKFEIKQYTEFLMVCLFTGINEHFTSDRD